MLFKNLSVEKYNRISILTIDREKFLNAVNIETLNELFNALKMIEDDTEQRVLIITGAGKKSFVAGADILEMKDISANKAYEISKLGHKVFDFIGKMRLPVIAAVNGFALGGGLELALACDFIYGSKNSIFGLVETSLGLIPGFGGIGRLKCRVGAARALEMIFLAEKIKAVDAVKINLINRIMSGDVLMESISYAEKISLQSPKAIATCKRLFSISSDLDLRVVNLIEQQSFSSTFLTSDCKEGINAFLSKRKPNF